MKMLAGSSTLGLVASLVVGAGCGIGSIDGGEGVPVEDAGDPAAQQARDFFEAQALPEFERSCGSCHSTDSMGVGFLADPAYETVTGLDWVHVLNFDDPGASLIINKGVHSGGPSVTADQLPVFQEWLQLEAAWRDTGGPVIETDIIVPLAGAPTTVALDGIGLPGASISFILDGGLTSGMYLIQVNVNGGPDGAHLVHPLFVSWRNGVATPDPIDRFSELDLIVEADGTAQLGGGAIVLTSALPGDGLSLHFEVVETADGMPGNGDPGGGSTGGCKDVASFTANAATPLANNCANTCHGGGGANGQGAMDLANLGVDDANACAQVLSRVTLAAPNTSTIFVATDPNGGANHPFQFGGNAGNHTAFRDAVSLWIQAEAQ